jgi:hypothetical protein
MATYELRRDKTGSWQERLLAGAFLLELLLVWGVFYLLACRLFR